MRSIGLNAPCGAGCLLAGTRPREGRLLEVLMCLLGWMFSDNMAADVTVEGNLF